MQTFHFSSTGETQFVPERQKAARRARQSPAPYTLLHSTGEIAWHDRAAPSAEPVPPVSPVDIDQRLRQDHVHLHSTGEHIFRATKRSSLGDLSGAGGEPPPTSGSCPDV